MTNKLIEDTKAAIGDLIPAAIVIAVLIVLFTIIPVIGYNVDSTWIPPGAGAAGYQWNSTCNVAGCAFGTGGGAAMTNGSELWITNSPLMALAVLIGIVFTAIGMLLTNGKGLNGGGGL